MFRTYDIKSSEIYKEFQLKEDCLKEYKSLNNKNRTMVKWKYIIIFLFILILLFNPINVKLPDKPYGPNDFNPLWFWWVGLLYPLINGIAFSLRLGIFRNIYKGPEIQLTLKEVLIEDVWKDIRTTLFRKSSFHSSKLTFINTLKFLFTPDYFWAEYFKSKLGVYVSKEKLILIKNQERIRLLKKFYIEQCNWLNVITTVVITMIVTFIFSEYTSLYGPMPFLIFLFVAFRVISRSLEILLAFYNDVVNKREKLFYMIEKEYYVINNDSREKLSTKDKDKLEEGKKYYVYPWKNTLLLSSARTSLALHSLLEITIIFALLYFLLNGINSYIPQTTPPEELKENLGVIKYFLYSFSVAVTLPEIKPISYWTIAQAMQLLDSLVLLIMSVAYYLGKESELMQHEKDIYANIKHQDYTKE